MPATTAITELSDGESPFHQGEQCVQERLGVRDAIEPWARRVVRRELPETHRRFYSQLPFVVLAARDAAGRPWATVLAGTPGFANSPDPGTLQIDALPSAGDALADGLGRDADLGILGIELHTRRRNRVNGRVARREGRGLTLSVEQSFGNCPQYITRREWQPAPAGSLSARGTRSARLSGDQIRWITRADTFFIATGFRGDGENPAYGMDASHRGGAPGFVRVVGSDELVFPIMRATTTSIRSAIC